MAKRFENPLLSDKRLREIYAAMLGARVLAEGSARRRTSIARGLEACWAGSAIGLREREGEGDFACAGAAAGSELDLVLGLPPKAVLRGERSPARLEFEGATPMERVCFALGAARGLGEGKGVALIYSRLGEISRAGWKRSLTEALRMELPAVFLAIPQRGSEAGIAELSSRSGVPGIPVDASDAVAMYRVAQESIGRARAGGGPALIEAVVLPGSIDPIAQMKAHLVGKGVASERWATALEDRIRARLTQ